MIHVTIYKNTDQMVNGFQVEGHAGYAGEGEFDVVCASVSMLTINTVNSIEEFTEDDFSCVEDPEGGLLAVHLQGTVSHDSEVLLKSLVLGFETLVNTDNYSEFIDLTFEEV